MKNTAKTVFFSTACVLTVSLAASSAVLAADSDKCGGDSVAVANVSDSLLIRDSASESGKVIGYVPSAAGVIVESMDSEWTKIQIGDVSGYVKTEYLAFDEDAEALKSVYGVYGAVASWDDVKVFADYEDTSTVIGTLQAGEGYEILGSTENWVEIQLSSGDIAYVAAEDVETTLVLDTAVALDEPVEMAADSGSSDTETTADESAETAYIEESGADGSASDMTYEEPGYTEPVYEDGGYTDTTYTDSSYTDTTYTDGSYTDTTYTDSSYTDTTYTDSSYTDTSYTDSSYTDTTYTDTTYTDSGYTDTTYTDTTYTDTTYTDTTYTDSSYTDTTYTDSSYTDTTYTDSSYTDTTYTDSSYTDTTYTDTTQTTETEAAETEAASTSSASASDTELLAALIYCEAGNQSYEGMVAVGQVVMNRVASSSFANTISGVIYESGQFTPASSGMLESVLGNVPDECYQAAVDAINGGGTVGDALYFNTSAGKGIQIGDHWFY